jgi:hypothetical protein
MRFAVWLTRNLDAASQTQSRSRCSAAKAGPDTSNISLPGWAK